MPRRGATMAIGASSSPASARRRGGRGRRARRPPMLAAGRAAPTAHGLRLWRSVAGRARCNADQSTHSAQSASAGSRRRAAVDLGDDHRAQLVLDHAVGHLGAVGEVAERHRQPARATAELRRRGGVGPPRAGSRRAGVAAAGVDPHPGPRPLGGRPPGEEHSPVLPHDVARERQVEGRRVVMRERLRQRGPGPAPCIQQDHVVDVVRITRRTDKTVYDVEHCPSKLHIKWSLG